MIAEDLKQFVKIDLNQFKLHLFLKPEAELTLHFDSPSRRFYLSVICLILYEMKKRKRITFIPLLEHLDELILLNRTIGASAGASDKKYLLPRIYRKWKDSLPDLENAPLFKIMGKKKKYDDLMEKTYQFSEKEKDNWANLFEYKGSHENVELRFSINQLSLDLKEVVIIFGDDSELKGAAAWESFLKELEKKPENYLTRHPINSEFNDSKIPTGNLEKSLKQKPKNQQKKILSLFIILLVFFFSFTILHYRSSGPKIEKASLKNMALPLPQKPSIAILPFRNLSDEQNQEYFCDGLTEEIITGLSKVPSIFVIAHNSTALYKEQHVSIRQVSENLGIQYVLNGSVKKSENKIRITAKFIDALKGRQLWSEHYDRDLEDIFAIYDEITLKIIISMNVTLSKLEEARYIKRGTNNLDAYLKILQGIEHFKRFNRVDNNISRRRFEEAILIDPNYPIPYGYIALTHALDVWLGFTKTPGESISQGIEFVRKAMSIDDEIEIPHTAMARFYLLRRQHLEAIEEVKTAIRLSPNSPYVYNMMGEILIFSGKPEEAIAHLKVSERLDPLAKSGYHFLLGMACREAERYDEAIDACKKSIKIQPDNILTRLILAASYSMTGRMEEAQAQAAEVFRINPKFSLRRLAKVRPHIDPQNTERFIQSLRNAGIQDN